MKTPWKPESVPYVLLRVIPDRTVRNEDTEVLAAGLHALYRTPAQRFEATPEAVIFHKPLCAGWEVVLRRGKAVFLLRVPASQKDWATQKIAEIWSRATVREAEDWTASLSSVQGAELRQKNHFFLSLKVEKRSCAPLPALLEVVKLLEEQDLAAVQVILNPEAADWYEHAVEAYNTFRQGKMPRRFDLSLPEVARQTARLGAAVGLEVRSWVAEFITEEPTKPEEMEDADRALILRDGPLSKATVQKPRGDAFDATIRVLCQSSDARRGEVIVRSLATGFRSLAEDNELVPRAVKDTKKWLQAVRARTVSTIRVNPNILSTAEVGRLLCLPPASLQLQHPEMEVVALREQPILPQLESGLPLGTVRHKGRVVPVHLPLGKVDELVSPWVVIGGMGSGKSTFGTNWAVNAVKAGYSAFLLDMADGQACDEARDAIPPELADKVIDLDFGDKANPIGLDWGEVAEYSPNISDALAEELVAFFEKFSDEPGSRTRRWLRKAAQAVYEDPNATILDVLLMLLAPDYRQARATGLKSPSARQAWEQFAKMSPAMQQQVVQPVMNRLDYLLDNRAIKACLCQPPKRDGMGRRLLNFRKWLDGGYLVLLRVPQAVLRDSATDAIVTFLVSKLWLAALTRESQPMELRRPAWFIMDEPHRCLSAASIWQAMAVDTRRHRLGLVWLFHSWAQIRDKSKELAKIIKAAGCNYLVLPSSKDTYEELSEEIAPFEVAEALSCPPYAGICRMRAGGQQIEPFLLHTLPPPKKFADRESLRRLCGKTFGRPLEAVEREIMDKEAMLQF